MTIRHNDHEDENAKIIGLSAGWFVAGALAVALIGGGVYYYRDGFTSNDDKVKIELDLPKLDLPNKGPLQTPPPGRD